MSSLYENSSKFDEFYDILNGKSDTISYLDDEKVNDFNESSLKNVTSDVDKNALENAKRITELEDENFQLKVKVMLSEVISDSCKFALDDKDKYIEKLSKNYEKKVAELKEEIKEKSEYIELLKSAKSNNFICKLRDMLEEYFSE